MATKKKAPSRGLKYSDASHRYWLDGKPITGVTSLIGCLDKPALPRWAAKTVAQYVADNPDGVQALREMGSETLVKSLAGIPWERRDKAADHGGKFHDLAEAIINGAEVDVPDELVGKVEAALAFMSDCNVDPIVTEKSCASREHWYAGRFDLVADLDLPGVGRVRAIVDWKSGKGIYSSVAWQLAAYGMAEFYVDHNGGEEHAMSELGITHSVGVHIRDDGYGLHKCKYDTDVHQQFIDIARVARHKKACEGDWRKPGSGYISEDLTNEGATA